MVPVISGEDRSCVTVLVTSQVGIQAEVFIAHDKYLLSPALWFGF